MSIFSDYECGAMDDDEFRDACRRLNRMDRYEREHEFDEVMEEDEEEEETETCNGCTHPCVMYEPTMRCCDKKGR